MRGSRAGASVAARMQEESGEPMASASSEPAPAIRYDFRVLQALRRIIRAVDLHSRKLSARHKITGPQLVCLLSVAEYEPVTPSAIARHIHLSPSTVIGILDRLEAKGLVRRERDQKDRRLVQVSLTEQGKALVVSAPSPLQDTLAEAMNKLPEAELATIADSLDQLVELMEVRHIDAAPILETGPIGPTTGEARAVEPPGGGEPGGEQTGR
jgi:DNA-binding MarR family transcriptional regulator